MKVIGFLGWVYVVKTKGWLESRGSGISANRVREFTLDYTSLFVAAGANP